MYDVNGDPDPNNVVNACARQGITAYIAKLKSSLGIGLKQEHRQALTLCPNGFFSQKANTLDTSNTASGVLLNDLESKSLMLVHELFHLAFPNPSETKDLPIWGPPQGVKPLDSKGNPNPDYPGDPASFMTDGKT
jgi:hypothetical protein